ncbi:CcdB family protein [Ottowia sp.]|uniref:CcdB family protein n=1 Tax=Ottowia sp. TaxID=1898956 RepID=UPI0039E3A24C
MARFDVYANPDPSERAAVPFFLDVQNDFLGGLHTRVMVPLYAGARFSVRIKNMNPELQAAGKAVVMDTASIGALPTAELRRPVDNFARYQVEIQDALDTLFGAY